MKTAKQIESDIDRAFYLLGLCYEIYHKRGGYEHHDNMHYTLQGMSSAMMECEDDDWAEMLPICEDTHKWFLWVEATFVLIDGEPTKIFG